MSWTTLVEEIRESGEGVTAWEQEFMSSIMAKREQWPTLTDKQQAILNKISKERLKKDEETVL